MFILNYVFFTPFGLVKKIYKLQFKTSDYECQIYMYLQN